MAQVAEEKKQDNNDDDKPEETDGYKAPEKKSVNEILNSDKDDKSLQKYKEDLGLGKNVVIDENDKRQVLFDLLVIAPVGRKEIELVPSKCKADTVAFTLKEGCKYQIKIKFRVQREIVIGLKKFNVVKRKGIRVEKSTEMMGSFAPDKDKTYEQPFPQETTPSGMLARGKYVAKTQFLDDDGTVHLDFSYQFKIAKNWD
eukprot:179937_1